MTKQTPDPAQQGLQRPRSPPAGPWEAGGRVEVWRGRLLQEGGAMRWELLAEVMFLTLQRLVQAW